MSGKDREAKRDLDYAVLHKTGDKVDKDRKMEAVRREKRVKEMQICDDLDEAFTLYALKELVTEDEISEGLDHISELFKEYRHIHVDLKELLGDEAYATAYPKDEVTEKARTYMTEARKQRKLKSEEKQTEVDKQKVKETEEKVNKEQEEHKSVKALFMIEEQAFHQKLDNEIGSLSLINIEEIKEHGSRFQSLLDEYFKLLPKAKHIFDDKFDEEFKDGFEKTVAKIRKQIFSCKTKIRELNEADEKARALKEKTKYDQTQEAMLAEHLFNVSTLTTEIKMRCNALIQRCDCDSLSSSDDHQILALNKSLPSIDIEMREILDKFTAISKVAAMCGEKRDALLAEPKNQQTKALQARNKYAQLLYQLVTSRDISEDKLRSSATVPIELPKFKGYDSKHDIYTFKSNFEKFVQHRLQKPLWLHFLRESYLDGPAKVLVDKVETIEEAWTVLTNAYGNVKLMLQNKIGNLGKIQCLDKIEGDEKIMVALAKIINMMIELSTLASKHDLGVKLYVGGGLEKLYSVIGSERERKFLTKSVSNPPLNSTTGPADLEEKVEWDNLLKFLQKEYAAREKMTQVQKSKDSMGIKTVSKLPGGQGSGNSANMAAQGGTLLCHICGQAGHIVSVDRAGKKHVDYYSCKIFVDMSGLERQDQLRSKNLCLQCLLPGAKADSNHKCFIKYRCPNTYHNQYPKGIHVLLCSAHKNDQKNIDLLKQFKEKIIAKRSDKFQTFTKNISLVCGSVSLVTSQTVTFPGAPADKIIPDVRDNAGFQLQTIKIGDVTLNLFYDSGCGDIVIKKSAIDKLSNLGLASLEIPGPLKLKGVGDHLTISEHGAYSICLPLKNGMFITMSGICLDRVTAEFGRFSLENVECDIHTACKNIGGSSLLKSLPKLPSSVGGDTDILIGSKYLKIHPQQIWKAPSGLTISDSFFFNPDGTTGVVHGPHPEFNMSIGHGNSAYLVSEVVVYRNAFQTCCSSPLLQERYETAHTFCSEQDTVLSLATQKGTRCGEIFHELDRAGTEVSYRCGDCRACPNCKKSPRIEEVSIEEELQQELIEQCVQVDEYNQTTTHTLPFLEDPETKLVPNKKFALKIYESQVKKLDKNPADKEAAIEFDKKLQDLGYVDYVDNLPEEERKMIVDAPVKYFIPWLVVYNENSVSTPCRLVFDASVCPRGGCSLNSLLAKGTNNMNRLINILISWSGHRFAFHADIRKMYNTIYLDKKHWKYQLYFWDNKLRIGVAPRPKVIKSAIFGVRSSGNVAEAGVRKTAELIKDRFPKAHRTIMNELYVDDCLSGENSQAEAEELADQLTVGMMKGGYVFKYFIFSGKDPPAESTIDGVSVVVGGYRWFTKEDQIGLNIPKLGFSKKKRGRKKIVMDMDEFILVITKRNCVSRVYEIFDPRGLLAPLLCRFKIDLHELTTRKLDWDDKIPEDLRQIWKDNFEMIDQISNIRFKRAVIPEDAVGIELETIDTADASQQMVCVAIYVRFPLKSGGYSCQLVFARTKIVAPDTSQPRAELLAALMNASSGHVVKISFGDKHKRCWKLTDSQVALHWIRSKRSKLKLGVRNSTIEINRLSDVQDWRYCESKDMIADLGTRRGASFDDVGPDSQWINGLNWMSGEESEFPVWTADELIQNAEIEQAVKKEMISVPSDHANVESAFNAIYMPTRYVPEGVKDHYDFSQYIIDPNRFRFRKVIRVLGLVFLFIKKARRRCGKPVPKLFEHPPAEIPGIFAYRGDQFIITTGKYCKGGLVVDLSKDMINSALRYYFLKASEEIRHFLPASSYQNISEDKNNVLHFTGRILPTLETTGELTLGDVSFDLDQSTFCVPLIDRESPIAYALSSEIHWHHPDVKHGGIESVLRHVQGVAYLIGTHKQDRGRKLIIDLKKACERCRFLEKRAIKVAMGPKDPSNICIAPAFYNTQVDICGPYDSYSNSNKRAKVKVWFVIFCCCATGAVDAKLMEDYSTDSFLLAFIRFSCRYGYPHKLYPDSGSQLLKGCTDMVLSYCDIKNRLSTDYGVDFDTCPVGSHYVHGKVERKIQEVKKSIEKSLNNHRLSVIQWETLGQQISNSINNLPIGLGNKCDNLENLDLITPNRLLLGRNNSRGPTSPLLLSDDTKRIIETNANIFQVWFKSWLISYVPSLVHQPKWFDSDKDITVGDVVLFLKSEKEFEHLYQYGRVSQVFPGKDGRIRSVEVEYQNNNEKTKRTTKRGVRELVIIHHVDELGINRELHDLANSS